MPSVTVDVDLSEFDLDEIIDELETRLNRELRKKNSWAINKKKELVNITEQLMDALSIAIPPSIPSNSLEDKMKIEHLASVWDKYRSFEIEKLLP